SAHLMLVLCHFIFAVYPAHPVLPSFPTRRSSDLIDVRRLGGHVIVAYARARPFAGRLECRPGLFAEDGLAVAVDHLARPPRNQNAVRRRAREPDDVAHAVTPEAAAGGHEEGIPHVHVDIRDGQSPGIGHAQFVHPDELEEDAVVQVKQHRWIPQIILKGKESLRWAVGLDEMQVRLADGLTEQVTIGASATPPEMKTWRLGQTSATCRAERPVRCLWRSSSSRKNTRAHVGAMTS